jgi:hypothetical protein
MLSLMSQPLAAALAEDAMRAGRQHRLRPRSPQRVALLGRLTGRRDVRPTRRAAHA